ncbi:PHP domain-containing protein [Georgenia halophila]|uniref:Histidinol-phosphatase n=1 Tax=Georgenia halophila TaxID=620889 RepID=A0ABP8LEZ5_9MICO
MALPADTHVHSEWSWDTGGPSSAAAGSMEATCRQALRIGLPTLIFTEHLDLTSWVVDERDLPGDLRVHADPDGEFHPPVLDVAGYLECVERCRRQFPELHVLTGVEFGQPHVDTAPAAEPRNTTAREVGASDLKALDRVNGSLHTLPVGGRRHEPSVLYRMWPPERVVREYLDEVCRMIAGSDAFEVLCHIEYAVRYWPSERVGPFDPGQFEDSFRQAMRVLAGSGRALEINLAQQIRPWILQWWRDEGGRAITFGSDAHEPQLLAKAFPEAMAMAEHYGFRPGRWPADFWTR